VAARIAGVVGLLLAWMFVRRGIRLGLELKPGGEVTVYGPFSTITLSRDEIADVDTHKWFANKVVDIKLQGGRSIPTTLIQGARVSSQAGETKDIVGVLRRELLRA